MQNWEAVKRGEMQRLVYALALYCLMCRAWCAQHYIKAAGHCQWWVLCVMVAPHLGINVLPTKKAGGISEVDGLTTLVTLY